jgi:predicted GIY-YIG superfamily endonuclease
MTALKVLEARPHYVYRAFDDLGLLLYVGCSTDVARRLAQHRSRGLWAQYMSDLTSSGPMGRDEALLAETKAIATEGPFFNAQPEHTVMVQANRNAALRMLHSLPISYEPGDEVGSVAFYEARNAIGLLIRHTHPIVDDDVRTQWYLAERVRAEREKATA